MNYPNRANIKKTIEVKFVLQGVHRFPRATEPQFATGDWDDVSFLANLHMHYFHFIVQVEVKHLDRDLEFIQFQRWCQRQYSENTLQLDSKSCEMLAQELLDAIYARYPGRWIKVSVLEDNINGAHVEYTPSTGIHFNPGAA